MQNYTKANQDDIEMKSTESRFSRTALIFGEDGVEKLAKSSVIVFGAGGVGGYVIEGLARSGVGRIDIVDMDKIALSNINRQILALEDTVGLSKVEVATNRIKSINPEIKTNGYEFFFLPETL